jgi:hypothetical protein
MLESHFHHVQLSFFTTSRYAKEQLGSTERAGAFGAARRWRSEAALDRLGPGGAQGCI